MRKRICVIMMGFQSEYSRMAIEGMTEQAKVLNYDIFVFSYFGLRTPGEKTFKGETNILNLIEPKDYDAFVIHKGLIQEALIRHQIVSIAELSQKPVIDFDEMESAASGSLMWKDRENFRKITEHLIQVHGFRKIWCITGQKGNAQATARLQGYRDALLASGIQPHAEWEFYGDFWRDYAKTIADKIAEGSLLMPEAIACAATIPAVSLIERLAEHGIRVPEDIAVTGYDCFLEGELCSPAVTYVSAPYYNHGVHVICHMHQLLTGELVQPIPLFEERVHPAGSCGCSESGSGLMRRIKRELLEQLSYQELFRNSGMLEQLSDVDNEEDFFSRLSHLEYLIRGVQTVRYFLCNDWDGINNQTGTGYRSSGYAETFYVYTHASSHGSDIAQIQRKEMLQSILSSEKPETYFFFPIHYEDRAFGFICLDFTVSRCAPDSLFWSWLELLDNALEMLRVRYYLSRFSERKHYAALRDNLTGLYNRRGFEECAEEMYEYAVIHQECLFLAMLRIYNIDEVNKTIGFKRTDVLLGSLSEVLIRHAKGNLVPCHVSRGYFIAVGTYPIGAHFPGSPKKQFIDACRMVTSDYEDEIHIDMDTEAFMGLIGEKTLKAIISELEAKQNKAHHNDYKYQVHIHNILKIRNDIYQNPEQKRTVEELAHTAMLSVGYFQRLYKQTFGVSVSADMIKARIELVKELLTHGKKITDTATLCGYTSDTYFMHQFKNITGLTPSSWLYNRKYK